MMDSGILPGMYNHIVIAVHFQKINSVCVCVFFAHAPFLSKVCAGQRRNSTVRMNILATLAPAAVS